MAFLEEGRGFAEDVLVYVEVFLIGAHDHGDDLRVV